MTNIYLFKDKTIGVFEHRIDLLRNNYAHDKIEYNEIKNIYIKIDFIKNWIILLCFGIVLIATASLIVLYVYNNSAPGDFISNLLTFLIGSRGAGLIAVLFLLAFGIYSIIVSLSKTPSLIIQTNDRRKHFVIKRIYKEQKLDSLIQFLKERVNNIIVDDTLT